MEHRLQINDGAVGAAEFVELSEFNPLREVGRAIRRVVARGWAREERGIV